MLTYMSESKRILNLHEKKFVELVLFQANTTVFQANTNASLKNLETQVGQLALAMQNQSGTLSIVTQRKILKTEWMLL